MKSLHEHLTALAQAESSRTALIVCGQTGTIEKEISRAELLLEIERASRYMLNSGIRAGDKIALSFHNSAELLIISWAAWSMGIITVPLDMKRDTEELREYKIKASGAKLLITQEEFLQTKDTPCDLAWAPDLSHDALILFTSGTTAHPKGAQLTLQNLIVNAESIIEWLHIGADDRFLVELPLHHINSTTFCLASLIAGASVAIPPVYSNSHFWEHAANSGATLTSVVPSIIFDQLGKVKEFEDVKDRIQLTRIQLGSAPVVSSDAREFMQKFSLPLYQGYGQTETALRVTGVPMDLSKEVYERLTQENSIGTPLSWAQVETTDVEGKILNESAEGELVVKGPAVMRGYINNEPAFRDGYFLTGDIGYWKEVSGKRFFFLIGRAKEIIIKGGINISPVAVENALKNISADIDQAYVIGVDDKRYGEEVGAAIVWKKDVEPESALRRLKLILLVTHESLSAYETPAYLVTVPADQLPTTSTGKVQRMVLRKKLDGSLEPLSAFMQSDDFRFEIITPQSPLATASRVLYNHCWQPLTKSASEYKKYLGEYLTLGACNKKGELAGQISFSYADNKMTCISICSASYKPKPVPEVATIPDAAFVRQYLLAGHDPVMHFHTKLGAELVDVTPGGRPEDRSALGYTMLLRYPPAKDVKLGGTVSSQLIQAVRILANDIGADVYAISRPGGLASHIARSV